MFPETISTVRLLLRPVALDDAPAIFAGYAQDPEVTRYLVWRPHQQLADTQAYVARCVGSGTSRTYVLTGRSDGVILGAIDLRLGAPHRLAFGYVLARAHWGRGLMTEVLQAVVRWALAQPAIFRIGQSATSTTSPPPALWKNPG